MVDVMTTSKAIRFLISVDIGSSYTWDALRLAVDYQKDGFKRVKVTYINQDTRILVQPIHKGIV